MVPEARRAITSGWANLRRTAGCAALLALSLIALAGRAAPLAPLPAQPSDVPWPDAQWPRGPLPGGVDAEPLERSLAVVGSTEPPLGETRAIVVIARGRLVVERYMPGFGSNTPLISWSMAKSMTHALVGIAARRGLVNIDRPMGNPRWSGDDPRSAIPWRFWLNMVDGQDYHELDAIEATKNDAARMLFGAGRRDVARFAAGLPLVHAPGSHWNYNSAGINLVADALGNVFAPGREPAERRARMNAVIREELFGPLGMSSAQAEFDAAGTFVGSAFAYATARDYARFGLLYLRDGLWNGRRILPEGWVDFARSKTPADDCDIYGAGFWITPATGSGKPMRALTPNGPRDLFAAQGHEGQIIAMVPSKDLIVVRLGHFDDRIGFRPLGDWLQALVALFPDVGNDATTAHPR
jgi:CubicO group peptidase (beta-lactamase class C family)